LVTIAVRLALPDSTRLWGAATLTEMVGDEVTVATAVAEAGVLWASVATAVAVIVTVPFVGTVDGARYVTADPLALGVGVMLPQLCNVLVHESFQSTPAFVLSPSTVAIRFAVSPLKAAPSVNAVGDR
jgi:hypothetical protein